MIDPSSPCDTPPHKRWEGAFKKFLRGQNPQHPSPPNSPSSSITSAQLGEDLSTGSAVSLASSSGTGGGIKASKKKSSFSLIPGSKRLVSRNTSALSSMFSKGSSSGAYFGGRISRGHKSMDALDVPLRKGMEKSKASSRSNGMPGSPTRYALTRRARTTPVETNESVALHFPSSVADATATGPLESTTSTSSSLSGTPPPCSSALDEQLRACAISNNSIPPPNDSSLERTLSMDFHTDAIVNEGVELPNDTASAPSLTQLHARRTQSQSRTYMYSSSSNPNTPVKQYQQPHHDELDLRMLPDFPSLKGLNSHHRLPSLDNLDVGLNLDESDNSHFEDPHHPYRQDQHQSVLDPYPNNRQKQPYSTSNTTGPTIMTDCGIEEPPESLDEILGGIGGVVTVHSSSSSHLLSMMDKRQMTISPETKKAFTKIHNSSEYGQDSISPFLGGHRASNIDLAGAYRSYAQHSTDGASRTQYGSIPRSTLFTQPQQQQQTQENQRSSSSLLSRSLPTESAAEQTAMNRNARLLKPIQSTEAWAQGRRYLIAPAALASCPPSTIVGLTGLSSQSATEAATSMDPPRVSGAIELGNCFMTYVGDKYHLTFGKWSSCRLVLRQNYLFEYDLAAPLTTLPRGIAHLQHATAHVQPDYEDALELHFYASPCAKVDHRVLLIRVKNKHERDHWITCLNKAARVRIEDLWDYEKDNPLGTGRYASIYPARRKAPKAKLNQEEDRCDQEQIITKATGPNCALKVIDKCEFWKLVMKGRERCDTIVRELAVQSTLTAKFGSKPTFLQIHGFFETSENIVIELELLEGKDLFEHISSKGVLEEEEAGLIIRDVLVALDSMNRAGVAHRDIKPANILMTKCDECKYGTSVKIGDFGMSTLVGVDGLVRGRCGSPGYVAPEIFKAETGEGYGNQVDVFSAGVTLYLMLCGYEPFYGENENELIKANKKAELEFPNSDWGKISPEARDLVAQMLKTDPRKRITPKKALEHKWILQLEQSQKRNSNSSRERANDTLGDPVLQDGVCAMM
jgi:serine/threonine protein kinase